MSEPNGDKHPQLPNGERFRFPTVNVQRGVAPFPPALQKALDAARESGNYYIIVCNADDKTADCTVAIHSERAAGFHRGNLVRAWQRAGMQILDFDPAVFESLVMRLVPTIADRVAAELDRRNSEPEAPSHASSVDKPDSP